MAHRPRLWIPYQVMHGSIRVVNREFLLRPSKDVNQIVASCLGRALKKFPVQLHACFAHTNHIHFLLSATPDQLKNGAAFFQYLNGNLARALNKHWDRTGPLWESRIRTEACVDDQAADAMLIYVMTNAVRNDIIAKSSEWIGFSTYKQLATGKAQTVSFINKKRWWKAGGPLSRKEKKDFEETVEIATTPLPHWQALSPKQQQRRFRETIFKAEQEQKNRRELEGKTVMGLHALRREDPHGKPATRPKRKPKPLCHASTKSAKRVFAQQWKAFVTAYRQASARYRSGILDTDFPEGSFKPPLISVCGFT